MLRGKLVLASVTLGTIRPEDSGAAFVEKAKSLDVWACLWGGLHDMSSAPY